MSEGRIVSLATDGEIAVISVNHPPVNTITATVRQELSNALDGLGRLAGVKAVVLRCEGSTFFSGADIGEFSGPPREAEYRSLFARFEALPMPVIAAMHGTVLGGGLEIALTCHYRIADPRTRFGLSGGDARYHPGRRRHPASATSHRRREGARAHSRGATGGYEGRAGARISGRRY